MTDRNVVTNISDFRVAVSFPIGGAPRAFRSAATASVRRRRRRVRSPTAAAFRSAAASFRGSYQKFSIRGWSV